MEGYLPEALPKECVKDLRGKGTMQGKHLPTNVFEFTMCFPFLCDAVLPLALPKKKGARGQWRH